MERKIIESIERDISLSKAGLGDNENGIIVGLFENISGENNDTFYDHIRWHRYFDYWSYAVGKDFIGTVRNYFRVHNSFFYLNPERFFERWEFLKESYVMWEDVQVMEYEIERTCDE